MHTVKTLVSALPAFQATAFAETSRPVSAPGHQTQFSNALRLIVALCMAPMGTILLLLLMNYLIDSDLPEPVVTPPINLADIFDIPEPVDPIQERPEDEIDEVLPPPMLIRDRSIDIQDSVPVDVADFGIQSAPGFDPSLVDSDVPIRLVAVAPQYPVRALGIEGFVDVRFDVTKAGTTENIEILAYEPSTVFNRAVLRAVSRWRYQPRLVEGQPVATKGVMERISFKMEN